MYNLIDRYIHILNYLLFLFFYKKIIIKYMEQETAKEFGAYKFQYNKYNEAKNIYIYIAQCSL